jgi:hypothetical protein
MRAISKDLAEKSNGENLPPVTLALISAYAARVIPCAMDVEE